jgi:hypothetical protein
VASSRPLLAAVASLSLTVGVLSGVQPPQLITDASGLAAPKSARRASGRRPFTGTVGASGRRSRRRLRYLPLPTTGYGSWQFRNVLPGSDLGSQCARMWIVTVPSNPVAPKHIPVVTPSVEQVRWPRMRTVAVPTEVAVSWAALAPEFGSGAGWVSVVWTGPLAARSTAVSQPAPIVRTSTPPTARLASAFCGCGRRVCAQARASCAPGGMGPSRGGAHGGNAAGALLDVAA